MTLEDLEARVAKLEAVAHPPMDLARVVTMQADAVARVVEKDPHQWSRRPCQSCLTISGLLGRAFGCEALRRKPLGKP